MQLTLVTSLHDLSSTMGAAMSEHDESAKARQIEIIQRIDTLDKGMQRALGELATLLQQSDAAHNQRYTTLSETMTNILEELRALRVQLVVLPEPTSEPEA